mgnify:CR=1 FL=1
MASRDLAMLDKQLKMAASTEGSNVRVGATTRVAGLLLLLPVALVSGGMAYAPPVSAAESAASFAGSQSCRECHEKFYELWSTSFHGLAMQPFTDAFAKKHLTPQAGEIAIGEYTYTVNLAPGAASIRERGPEGEKALAIAHTMGGKNVYYFLTPADRGMLQTLPLAYDVREGEWFDMAKSGMRHVAAGLDQPVDWRERPYTFNTSCYSCHVSQLSKNYDLATDSYHTSWAEPGINCETCHGPSGEHARVFKEAPAGQQPRELHLISTKTMTNAQRNDLCAPCHAKMQPVTSSFMPGERFFDHYGLVTLEDPDFYPDGRDLGENYTYTSWRMSPCVKSGQLDCMHCHTSSGRYRFADPATANNACAPCHQDKIDAPTAHTHHKADGEGSTCVSCHMPKTEFARMTRSDHSMRPPMPTATLEFGSPNACNLCHADNDAAWSDKYVREWQTQDYQAPVLDAARLVDAARKQDWSRLPEILAFIPSKDRDEVFRTSLIRLLASCHSEEKWEVIISALNEPSPLIRAAASEALDGYLSRESVVALLTAAQDDYRLVRVRAAAALGPLEPGQIPEEARAGLDTAMAEFLASMSARPDDYASHYNLGNYYSGQDEPNKAIAAYETAVKLNPGIAAPLVNASLVFSRQGRNSDAEKALRKALVIDPHSAPASFNLGLLLTELGRTQEAETALREALRNDPHLAQAAYNLGLLLAGQDKTEGLEWCRKAWELRPSESKYGYTLAFYQFKKGDSKGAVDTLENMMANQVASPDAYVLLGGIYEQQNELETAKSVYQRAVDDTSLDDGQHAAFAARAKALSLR